MMPLAHFRVKDVSNSFADEEGEGFLAFVFSPSERAKVFFRLISMKTGIFKNVLFSLALHGIALACCLAMPVQKLVPLFCAGDSTLTLTSLSIYQPGAVMPGNSFTLQEQRSDTDNHSQKETEPEIREKEENNPDNFSIESRDMQADKPLAVPPQGNVKNPKYQVEGKKPALFLDGDAQTKGIVDGLASNSGIHPYYPLGARVRGEEGIVKVEACVGGDGCVLNCAVVKSSGFLALDDAALVAVKSARFVTAHGTAPAKDIKTVLNFRFDLVD